MDRQAVHSSDIRSVGYDARSKLLEIEFHSGGIYEYFPVPSDTHESLMKADSKGKHFYSYIRDKYKHKRVR